jgi:hypothetical protein
MLAYAFGYSSDNTFYFAAFLQCAAYTWFFWLMARRQARAREHTS